MTESMQVRIDKMFSRDRWFAIILLACLWATLIFVFFAINVFVEDGTLRLVMIAGSVAVIIFNTASITAMLKHYAEDKKAIYEIDIRHLDTARAAKAAARAGGSSSYNAPN